MAFLRALIRDSRFSDWMEALKWLAFNVIGALMPVWALLIILRLLKQDIKIGSFTDHGEFMIYSASFVGAALYVVLRDIGSVPFPGRLLVSLLLIILLLIAAVSFSTVGLTDVLKQTDAIPMKELLDKTFLSTTSLIFLPFVCFVSYLIFIVDRVITFPNVSEINQENRNDLEHDFDELQGE